MDSRQNTDLSIKVALACSLAVIMSDANRSVKDFLSSNFVVFVLVLLATFKDNKTDNILVSVATAFFAVVLVRIITLDDFDYLQESFKLIYPGPTTSINCTNVKTEDLLLAFSNNISDLKKAMYESGVPMNLELNDNNAPEIATYLVNNPNIGNIGGCRLIPT